MTSASKTLLVVVAVLFYHFGNSQQTITGDNVTLPCYTQKYGLCPVKLINPSTYPCTSDSECAGPRRCCKFCSDPAGTRPHFQCPKPENFPLADDPPVRCITDINCRHLEFLTPPPPSPRKYYKCCRNPTSPTCYSQCVPVEENCYKIPEKTSTDKQLSNLCPLTLTNPGDVCFNHDNCPGNQACCPDYKTYWTMRCSDPVSFLPSSFCPSPEQMDMSDANSCTSDMDCLPLPTGPLKKCCPLDSCTYKCVFPERSNSPRGPIALSVQERINPNILGPQSFAPQGPGSFKTGQVGRGIVNLFNPSEIIPGFDPQADCDGRNRRICPRVITNNPSATQCQQIAECPLGEICCEDRTQGGISVCHLPSRPGKCPRREFVLRQKFDCRSDANCKPGRICCPTAECASYTCVDPDFNN